MKVTFQHDAEIKKGKTILNAARESEFPIKAPCKKGKCGKCKVRILSGQVAPLTKEEKKELTKKEIESGVRLACMAQVIEDVTVEVVKKKKK
jgi:ferredoxin